MRREYYANTIEGFLASKDEEILGHLSSHHGFALEQTQRDAWLAQFEILRHSLCNFEGTLYFEYSIPRMGKRIDVVLIIGSVLFVLEFKVGEKEYTSQALDQVWDYALDLKNFHEASHTVYVAPVLVATEATAAYPSVPLSTADDRLFRPIRTNSALLEEIITRVLLAAGTDPIDIQSWYQSRYCPTPTIVEAAIALYNGNTVEEISRNDAGAKNLSDTSSEISRIILESRANSRKAICFVTGVPGAGKTLVGLNIATQHIDNNTDLYSVFLSGNGPLVSVLREALVRDQVSRELRNGNKVTKSGVLSKVKAFVQNVHHFRDECLVSGYRPPIEHVALFDEAQRAWNEHQTSAFMRRKKGVRDFCQSEPSFLISCMDRHLDWAVIVCLVGGGQEINTGEAGIAEWIRALNDRFPHWDIHISPRIADTEYTGDGALESLKGSPRVHLNEALHLGVSMRSFRAENVSLLVKQLLDLDEDGANTLNALDARYPIVLTRDLTRAKKWIKERARGSERYGLVVSSQAERLKPHAIDVKSPMDPVHWFLGGKDDVRSSYYLEDVATEFHVQGLELDWTCVVWDADLRLVDNRWEYWSFSGNRWKHIRNEQNMRYLKNAYRVLLTRARQGMVIVVPLGDKEDPTRSPEFYDSTYRYLENLGFATL